MELRPKRISYSSRQGLKVEYSSIEEMTIGLNAMTTIAVLLKSLSDNSQEIEKDFTHTEHEVIQRYFFRLSDKMQQQYKTYSDTGSVSQIKRDFCQQLDWWSYCYSEGIHKVMIHLWGWNPTTDEALPIVDQLILKNSKKWDNQQPGRWLEQIARILGEPKASMPQPETKQKVEAVFGKQNWQQLKRQGRQMMKKWYSR